VREICMLRAMWRVLETGLRKLLNGHEDGNVGYSQGVSYGLPRQRPTLPGIHASELLSSRRSSAVETWSISARHVRTSGAVHYLPRHL
jgi:hypothetical protein